MRTRVIGKTVCLLAVLVIVVAGGALWASEESSGEVKLDSFYPTQLTRGQRTEIRVRLPEKAEVTGAEVKPPDGVVVAGITALDEKADNGMRRWLIEIDVNHAAEPGERDVVLTTSLGTTAAQKVVLPPHVPVLSDFKLINARMQPLLVEYSFVVNDTAGDLGSTPGLDSFLDCNGSIMGTVTKTTVGPGGVVRDSVGNKGARHCFAEL